MSKRVLAILVAGIAFAGFAPASALANCSKDRPGLIRSAETLKVDIEKLDEALHEAEAPGQVIGVIHHFEEGILEFVEDLRNGSTCQVAIEEFQHFHEDIQLIYRALSDRPDLFYRNAVLGAWNRMLPSYVRFQNRLYW